VTANCLVTLTCAIHTGCKPCRFICCDDCCTRTSPSRYVGSNERRVSFLGAGIDSIVGSLFGAAEVSAPVQEPQPRVEERFSEPIEVAVPHILYGDIHGASPKGSSSPVSIKSPVVGGMSSIEMLRTGAESPRASAPRSSPQKSPSVTATYRDEGVEGRRGSDAELLRGNDSDVDLDGGSSDDDLLDGFDGPLLDMGVRAGIL
jgi:hypothetical protein